jgi:hypothetical protein
MKQERNTKETQKKRKEKEEQANVYSKAIKALIRVRSIYLTTERKSHMWRKKKSS